MSDKPHDTLDMGRAGVAIEREINAKLRAENDRLKAERDAILRQYTIVYPSYADGTWEWRDTNHRVTAADSEAEAIEAVLAAVRQAAGLSPEEPKS